MNAPGIPQAPDPPDARRVAAAALLTLPGTTPGRLATLLGEHGDPRAALRSVEREARPRLDRDAVAARLVQRRAHVWVDGDSDYPVLDAFPRRPRVLLGEGARADAFRAPRVAIVGTRAASPHGLADARELGAFLAGHGVTIVSGLAIGIDAAAHEGALDAGGAAVGVVATGLDVVYPRRHRLLYERVRAAGVIVSEHWYGVQPRPERFPERNRIIAALADAVVVVEATATGGARITADIAARHGRTVYAMPGSRRNPAAVGCNALIADGAVSLLDPSDVLVALQRGVCGTHWRPRPEPPPDRDATAVHRALGGEPATLDQLLEHTGLPAGRVAAALRALEEQRCIEPSRGRWWPR